MEAVLGAGVALYKLKYGIGCHVGKDPSLVKTVKSLPSGTPSQIFLANPQSAKVSISDLELVQAAEALAQRSAADPAVALYIHAPYIINLASSTSGYQLDCLKTLLAYGAVIGAKGVVVHVGKHTTQTMEAAMAAMRANVETVLPSATPECPLLLETPAGQGTEMLRSYEEFVGFVKSFATPAFRLCVDTCHVFACGHQPKEYLERLVAEDRNLLALVHFNDSMDVCGACKDRHAFAGTGKIGAKTMNEIAELCKTHKIAAVIE
jgi:deoxyribonuclease-4